jgi:hypothetical protein
LGSDVISLPQDAEEQNMESEGESAI